MHLCEATVGQVVRFHYAKGSRPPGWRLLRVMEQRDDYIVFGMDLDLNELRTFNTDDATFVKVVADAGEEVVNPGDFLAVDASQLAPAQVLAAYRSLYGSALHSSRWDPDVKALVVRRIHEPRVEVEVAVADHVVDIAFYDHLGRKFGLRGVLPETFAEAVERTRAGDGRGVKVTMSVRRDDLDRLTDDLSDLYGSD
jgi:hypothetical protein